MYRLTTMGLRLSVQRSAWVRSVDAAAAQRPGLIPVVKGNGYGLGRITLMPLAARLTANGQIAVGTVYEAVDVPADRTALVLTPHVDALPATLPRTAVLTVDCLEHVEVLARHGWTGKVSIKLASTMHRYGAPPADVRHVHEAAEVAAMTVVGYGLHLPLAGSNASRRREVTDWLEHLGPGSEPLSISHLDPSSSSELSAESLPGHPGRPILIRCGTALWHADRSLLHLTADVLGVHRVQAGAVAGYHATRVPRDGHVVLVGAGSAHGVRPHDDGRSPFHFAHRRVAMIEPAHMHTSMLFVPSGDPLPSIGDRVDVQRPLLATTVDELVWVDG